MLRRFQETFLREGTAAGIDTACLSIPRGNGKSWLAAVIAATTLRPNSGGFRAGTESVLCAASLEQSRIVFRFVRSFLEDKPGYRFHDSANKVGIIHEPTNTRLRAVGSNGKTAFGLVNCPTLIFDEPGAAEVIGGQLLHDAIQTAQGKPYSPLRAIYIGTLAPAIDGWWHDLVKRGTHDSTYVQVLQGDPDKWDQWPEIRRCNPLTTVSKLFRKKLLQERDAAREDSRLKARFLSYRLNVPTAMKHDAAHGGRLGADRGPSGSTARRPAYRRRGSRRRPGLERGCRGVEKRAHGGNRRSARHPEP